MVVGTVEYVNSEKGYGFIRIPGQEKNVFFHARDLIRASFEDVRKGQGVSVGEIADTGRGTAARDVRLID